MSEFAKTIRIVATVCESTAIVTTTLRLYYRASRRHVGLDDAWAAFSLVAAIFLLAGAWIHADQSLSLEKRVMGYFILNACFTCVLWSARMSILFSVMRIIPHLMTLRRYSYFCAILFLAMWILLLVEKTYICAHHDEWQRQANAQCVLGKSVGAVELTTDIIADMILVVLPLRLLWDIGISSSTRKLLIAIFSSSMVTSVVSIVHTSFELGPDRDAEAINAHVEATVSLVVCNLAVLVTWLVRYIRRGEDLESMGWSESSSTRRSAFTSLRFSDNATIHLSAAGMSLGRASERERDGENPDPLYAKRKHGDLSSSVSRQETSRLTLVPDTKALAHERHSEDAPRGS